MIESADLVMAALAAGAAAGVSETATTAVKDSYSGLKSLAGKVLRRHQPDSDQATVEGQLADPETHRHELLAALTEAGVATHPELLNAARQVLGLVDPTGTAMGKYDVTVTNCTGVQVGGHNNMTIHVPK
ncbi:hypothetical protein M8C13_06965 [Crossiella sp. SN42]|uniref:RIP homotypic interaction motif-containing protein n=1 Tax=Crossiella sp. SN42 TaxID=2944808 RepID=UPI00207CFD50|nr:RIP homotypic interaction motif-containing protein [Crossiella sp. SN42]MCO1575497.1 hypothetical protein [Crossiella sp. SN42]